MFNAIAWWARNPVASNLLMFGILLSGFLGFQAMEREDLEVIDAVDIAEQARKIKSPDEIQCIRWALAVADLGIDKMKQMLQAGVTELQLWALLNYTNLANDGDWHDGRMLASGDRIGLTDNGLAFPRDTRQGLADEVAPVVGQGNRRRISPDADGIAFAVELDLGDIGL